MLTQVICFMLLLAAASSQSSLPGINQECGRREARQVAVAGETVTSDQPWRIVIYMRDSPTGRRYRTTGTLISPTHVVTYAWSVTDDYGNAHAASDFRLVAGGHLADYDVTEPDTQERNVTSVHRHEQYNRGSRVHDIAVLVAHAPFTFTRAVSSACVDWTGLLQPTPSQPVLTYGYGGGVFLTQPAAILSHEQCRREAREERRRYVSSDDICAKTTDNNTCWDVYGAGLLMERGDRFYLLGVGRAQLAYTYTDGCDLNRLYSYTSLTSHSSWLRRLIDKP